jgi:hypothetical protein
LASVRPALWTPMNLKLEPENTDRTICLERMMLGQLGDLRPDAYRRKAFEEMAVSVRPPSWGRFFALRKRKGGMVVSEGAPAQWKLTKEAAN